MSSASQLIEKQFNNTDTSKDTDEAVKLERRRSPRVHFGRLKEVVVSAR